MALGGYTVMPFDLIPDTIPVIGWLDDVLWVQIILWALSGTLDLFERRVYREAASHGSFCTSQLPMPWFCRAGLRPTVGASDSSNRTAAGNHPTHEHSAQLLLSNRSWPACRVQIACRLARGGCGTEVRGNNHDSRRGEKNLTLSTLVPGTAGSVTATS